MSVTSGAASFQQAVADSLNLYSNKGYTCTQTFSGPLGSGNCANGREKKKAEAAGKVCVDYGGRCGWTCNSY